MKFLPFLLLALTPLAAQAAAILTPADAASVLGVQRDVGGLTVTVGAIGTTGSVNNWPAGETPDHIVDGVGAKYLNFGKLDTGFIVTPAFGSSILNSIKLWSANDAEPRDPSSFAILGTNSAIAGGTMAMALFSPVASGALALPATRNAGGPAVLDDLNSQTVTFSNTAAYTSYLVLFPTVKDPVAANSMQIGEVQLFGNAVPEPGSSLVALLGLAGLAARRRR